MKKKALKVYFTILILSAVALIAACSVIEGPVYGSLRPNEDPGFTIYTSTNYVSNWVTIVGKKVAEVNDPMYDDYGWGPLIYPDDGGYGRDLTLMEQVSPNVGIHIADIHNVVISTNAGYIYFYIAFANRGYGWAKSSTDPTEWKDRFERLVINIWLSDGDTSGNTELYTYKNVGAEQVKKPFNATTELPWDFSIQMLGRGGVVVQASGGDNPTTDIGSIVSFGADYTNLTEEFKSPTNTSPVVVLKFKIVGATWDLSSMTKFVITTWDLEDYGGNGTGPFIPWGNIDLRAMSPTVGSYTYGCTNGETILTAYPLILEYVGKTADQTVVLKKNTIIGTSEWLKITY